VRKKKMKKGLCVYNQTRESFLSLNVALADGPLGRLRGLLGKMTLGSDEGLWVVPSRGVHTFGLLFPIDLIYLDAQNRVVHTVEHLGAFRIGPIRMQAESVLELQTRTIYSSNTRVGDQLLICPAERIENYMTSNEFRSGERYKSI
jgi:uncharacterized membrane protein (UPF0127 family)